MDYIFVQIVYRIDIDEIGVLKKKMYLCFFMFSGCFKYIIMKEVEFKFQQLIYMFEKINILWVCGNLYFMIQE